MDKKISEIRIWVPFIIAVTLVAGILLGHLIHSNAGESKTERKLATILSMVKNEYVDVVDIDSLLESVLPELMEGLDPHSAYIPACDLAQFNENLEGTLSGVGVTFTMSNDSAKVIEVVGGGPAQKAGLQAGDRIVTVNEMPVSGQGLSAEKVSSMIKGEKGSHVTLGIRRSSASRVLEFDLERGEVPLNSIDASYMLSDSVGYIRVNQFSRTTYDEFLNALSDLMTEGAESYVIDLRGNLGGYMEIAVFMANEFLPAGSPIVFTRTRDGKDDRIFMSDNTGSFHNAGIVVLLDEYSASSSEVFAGAIQDNDRGLIIGRRSFGKGLIQRQAQLPDSSALQMTIGRYYTPSGRCIQKDYSNQARYRNDLVDRFNHGEAFSADSIRQDTTEVYRTMHGRVVYGGGGIMPDIFVPSDTAKITGYYLNVINSALMHKFSFDYVDTNRDRLSVASDLKEFETLLPSDDMLLRQFVNYAAQNGIAPRWYYINISRDLIVNQLKAMIARDILGLSASYEVINRLDSTVNRALESILSGEADSLVPKN
jgi:carboxyl-terminal processing protease